ncbi:FliA/WhiG family RNA polymerase sigma factor [Ornithinibacillus halophilus]|uniref:RNA polymerase, sigma 28 subunit, SigD/FliA/WhiG n=1 Tax=Ornithinibacillus halophilus TaxID=930117 RepID=A0A1M5CBP7_9BACI|nr:FliA/WhiG family RNA polymerase sigma factor [Ornithinibacillus halophilus]SHF52145.1 RNA polymerase, sigma 28 subunit, SigD/FliA/WhiG [Ornithinibacillus halophilus]
MAVNSSPLEKELWAKWQKEQNNHTANQIIQHYMYLVNYHVERTASHLPSSVSKDDLRSLGMFGLYDALKKFDIDRDLKFDTYASFRIRGSIIDGLRKEDWLPRSTRDKIKKVEQLSQELEQKLQREPTSKEIAKYVDMSVDEVETTIKNSLFANVLSIEDKGKNQDNEFKEGIGYSIPDKKSGQPEENVLQNEIIKELLQGIQHLNEKEQMILSLFYQEELTFTEIGQVLELTTSRISQLHKKAIFKLRKILEKLA